MATEPIFMREAAILVKLETVSGTDSLPTSANFIRVKDFTLSPLEGDEVEYEQIQPFFGNFDSEMATRMRKLEMSVYLAGSGTAGTAPNFDPLLQITGTQATIVAVTSVTYAPITKAIKSASIYNNIGGTNYRLLQCRGSAALTTDAKGYPMIKFSLIGLYQPLEDAALPAIGGAASARAVPVNAQNSQLTLHGIPLRASAFGLDFANQFSHRTLIGFEGVHIFDRKSTYNTTFEAVPVATMDWEDRAIKGTKGALLFQHGLTAGNIVTVSAAGANVGKPSISNVEGIKMNAFSGRLVPTTAGNDEWSIAFT